MFIMGLHVNAGTVAINTLGYTFCSALWGLILLVIMYLGSLVRGFSHAEAAAVVSAGTMLLCFFFVVIGMLRVAFQYGRLSGADSLLR
jgi:TRAP-type C4-dicarboxylate transport system permease large subunit